MNLDDNNGHVLLRTPSGKERKLPKLRTGWKWVHVGDVTEVIRGASPRPKGDPRYFGGAIPWIMISDITRQPGKYLYGTKQGVTEAGAALSRRLPVGSLILSNSGTVCVPKILKIDGCIHDGFVAFPTLQKTVDLNFAYYWFENVRPTIINENRQGVTQVNLNTGIVREMHFPLAPIEEQERIVAEIEKEFTRLDAGLASLKRVQIALRRYRASVLKAACEGRLVPTEAELARKENRSYETGEQLLQRILKERREKWSGKGKYKEPVRVDLPSLPPPPEGWIYASVEQLGLVGEQAVLTGPFGTNLGREDFTDSGVPVLTISCLRETGVNLDKAEFVSGTKADELDRYRLRSGDLLFSRMASVGRAGIVGEALRGALFNYHIMRLRLDPSALLAKYYIAYVRGASQVERYLREVNHGATRAGINTEQLLNMPVAVPPVAEQERIVADIERRLSVIEELDGVVSTELQRATRLRQSILQQAFSTDS